MSWRGVNINCKNNKVQHLDEEPIYVRAYDLESFHYTYALPNTI